MKDPRVFRPFAGTLGLARALTVAVLLSAGLGWALVRPARAPGARQLSLAPARAHWDEPVNETKQKDDPEEVARQLREFEEDQKRRRNEPERNPDPSVDDFGGVLVEGK